MAWVEGGSVVGLDNRAQGSPAGRENVAVGEPPPQPPMESGAYGGVVSVTSITRSSTTATVTATSHGFSVGNKVRIIGANQSAYNGDQQVLTVADANTFTFIVHGSPTTPATGTITARIRR